MFDVTRMVMTLPAQLLSLAGFVTILGLCHEFIAVRRLGQSPARRKATGLAVAAVAYVAMCAAFVAFSELFASPQYPAALGDFLPRTVEASLWGDVAATFVCFAFSVVLSNTSMYDAYWSVLPPVIAAYWWASSADYDAGDPAASLAFASDRNRRRWLQMAVYIAWALRLTYNWARGWDGLHHVDWRYVRGVGSPQPFQQKTSPTLFWAMSLFSFHLYPTLQVFVAMVPSSLTLFTDKGAEGADAVAPLNLIDGLAFAMGIGAVVLQHVADNQMHAFRTRANKQPGEVMVAGVWGYSRHPNYLGENMHWWAHYLFALAAGGGSLSMYYMLCPASITLLFVTASIPIMEARMLARRPAYRAVVDSVPMLIPFTKFS